MNSSPWKMVPVSECCELIVDCVNKTAPTVPYPTPYKMIRTTNVRNGFIDLTECKYVTYETYKKWSRRVTVQEGDVILTREAPIGQVGLVRSSDTVFLGQRLMLYRTNRSVLDPHYLVYAFLSPLLQAQFRAHEGSGSVVSHIRVGDCYNFKIPLPPLSEQRRISTLLGALDDKILLLRNQNLILDLIARTVFKSWFIDFDPVRAKAEGREPEGVDADTAALFPDGFDETGRTAVPRGWRRGVLGDILFDWTERVGSRSVPVLSAVNSGELVPSKEVFRKQVHSTNTSHYKVVPPFAFAYNPSRINIGSIGLNETGQDGAVSPVYVVCRPVSVPVAYYVWHLLRTPAIREWINVLSSGTVRQNLTYRDFASIPVVIPPDELLERFLSIRSTLYRRVAHNQRMIDTLTALRAELLPRLISGKLRVPEAEEALKEVL